MKVKMLEYYQGADIVGMLEPGQVADVDDKLAALLIENKKAELVEVDEAPVVEPPKKKAGKK